MCVHDKGHIQLLNAWRIPDHFTHTHTHLHAHVCTHAFWKANRNSSTNAICSKVFLITPVLLWGNWKRGRSVCWITHNSVCVCERPVGKSPRTIMATHHCLLCFIGETDRYLPQQNDLVSVSFSVSFHLTCSFFCLFYLFINFLSVFLHFSSFLPLTAVALYSSTNFQTENLKT